MSEIELEEGYKVHILMTCITDVQGHDEEVFESRLECAHNSDLIYVQLRQAEIDEPDPSLVIVRAGHNVIVKTLLS
ncbi:hypothetical protein V1505DRAFT_91271 [Lipomyces doorenjongii]